MTSANEVWAVCILKPTQPAVHSALQKYGQWTAGVSHLPENIFQGWKQRKTQIEQSTGDLQGVPFPVVYNCLHRDRETGHSCSSLVRVKSCRHESYLRVKLAREGALQCCSIQERDPSLFHLPGLLLMHKKRGLYQSQAKSYREFLWFLAFLYRKAMDRLDPEICTSFPKVFILYQVHSLHLSPEFHLSCTQLLQILRAHPAKSTDLEMCRGNWVSQQSSRQQVTTSFWADKNQTLITHNSGL